MENSRPHDHRRFLTVAISILLAIALTQGLRAAEREPLNILLTNDDGFEAPGIRAVHQVLVAAGHNITVVAPLGNQSGSSVRITTGGVLGFTQQAPGVWSVDGSPADSVLVGLRHIFKDADLPDIVISGANFGHNLGYASISGTVGAATMAMYEGVPAIAVSVGVDDSEQDAAPVQYPSTIGAFAGAAHLTLTILDDLQGSVRNTEGLLPPHTILNVNYPAVSADELKGVRMAIASRGATGYLIDYEDSEQSGQLDVKLTVARPDKEGDSDTDMELFFERYATITVLDGDWDAGINLRTDVAGRLLDIVE